MNSFSLFILARSRFGSKKINSVIYLSTLRQISDVREQNYYNKILFDIQHALADLRVASGIETLEARRTSSDHLPGGSGI